MVRKQIIDSARSLYARKGFTATSIEEISEMAGVSLPVTYHYVKKKSEIMRMVMEDFLNGFRASLAEKMRDIDHTHLEMPFVLSFIEGDLSSLFLNITAILLEPIPGNT